MEVHAHQLSSTVDENYERYYTITRTFRTTYVYRLTYLLYLSTSVAELSIYLRNKETQQTLWVTVVRMCDASLW